MMKKIAAFTLIELLVVIGIILLMMSLARPVFDMVAMDSQVGYAADKMAGFLNFARQTAISKNHPVEVRFYQYADPSIPGEAEGSPESGKFRAYQAFESLDDGSVKAIGKVEYLPGPVFINENAEISSLLDSSLEKKWTTLDSQVKLPRSSNYRCRAFIFRPSGDAGLSSSQNWFLTLQKATGGASGATPPPNFATVQIDPLGGAVSTYRP